MMSGRQALAAIENAVAEARSAEDRFDAVLRSATDQAGRLRAERAEAFKQLARVRLDTLTSDGVTQELDAAERRALALLDKRRGALADLGERRRRDAKAVAQAEEVRHAAAQAYEEALQALEVFEEKAGEAARGTAPYAAAMADVERAVQVLEEARKKAEVAAVDRDEKRKPYESDPLFMYLWRRRFGTAEYKENGFTRFMDRFVARLVGYDKARPNYLMMIELPDRLVEHAARAEALIGASRQRMAEIESEELGKLGAQPLQDALKAAAERLQATEAELASRREAVAALDREHDDLTEGRGDVGYDQAVEILAAADSRDTIQDLYRAAALTPTPEDDPIVRRIDELEQQIARAEQEIVSTREEMRQLARRRAEIESQREDFRKKGYDNPYGSFGNGPDIGNILGQVLKGALTGAVLEKVLRDGYRQREPRWDPTRGGGSPFPGGPWGGGSGGGSWGGGGRREDRGGGGGDGFRTGGSF
jgi:uncharacterized membrane protein YgcG